MRKRGVVLVGVLLLAALPVSVTEAADCGKTASYTAAWEVQGGGTSSPLTGVTLGDVRGIVTADMQQGTPGPSPAQGFFLQAHEPDCNAATSDGVFVFTGSSAKSVQRGDLVRLAGARVVEYRGPASFQWDDTLTELDCRSGCTVSRLATAQPLPVAEDLAPPSGEAASRAYFEAREGARVEVRDALTVLEGTDFDEAITVRGGLQDRLHESGPPWGHRIWVSGEAVGAARCGAEGLPDAQTFDVLAYAPSQGKMVSGPLTYGFNHYSVLQDDDTACFQVTRGDDASYDPADGPLPPDGLDAVTFATWNVENLFDTSDDPFKDDDLPSQAELDHKLGKLAEAVCSPAGLHAPLILAVQEAENLQVLAQLAEEILRTCALAYVPHLLDGPDGRGIDVGFLTRAERVVPLHLEAVQGCSARNRGITYEPLDARPFKLCAGAEPHWLHARHPLALTALVATTSGPHVVHALSAHFKSRIPSSNCSAADCSDWRMEEAANVRAWAEGHLALTPQAWVVVLGDLNDHRDSAAVRSLLAPQGPLASVWDDLAGPPSTGQGSIRRYSYIHDGVATELDHVLVSPALDAVPRVVSPRHLGPDWPASREADGSMFRASDHDPLVVAVFPELPVTG